MPRRTAFGDAPVCVVCHYLLFWIGRARSGARSRVCEMWLKCDSSSSSGGSNCVHPTLIPSLSLPCIDARPTHALNPTQARFSMLMLLSHIIMGFRKSWTPTWQVSRNISPVRSWVHVTFILLVYCSSCTLSNSIRAFLNALPDKGCTQWVGACKHVVPDLWWKQFPNWPQIQVASITWLFICWRWKYISGQGTSSEI